MSSRSANQTGNTINFVRKPFAKGLHKLKPDIHYVGRAKDGRVIGYANYGSASDFRKIKAQFTLEAYLDIHLSLLELQRMMLDALCACDGRKYGYGSLSSDPSASSTIH